MKNRRQIHPIFLFLFSLFTLGIPHLHSDLFVNETPVTIIQGPQSSLNRPEGASFSPSGNCLVIANSSGCSLTFYKRIGDSGGKYEIAPSFVIKDSKLLNYAHDVAFSPCGQYVVAACRESNTLACYKRKKGSEIAFIRRPHWLIEGFHKAKLHKPTSIAFSPCGQIIAVANRMGNYSTNFYAQIPGGDFQFDPVPFQTITAEELAKHNVSASHGLAFTPDGNHLATMHKSWWQTPSGESAFTFADKESLGDMTCHFSLSNVELYGCTCLHSIAFHPSGKYLAATHESGDVIIFEKVAASNEYVSMTSISIDKRGKHEGPKGIAFSPCGRYLAVTTVANFVLIYEVEEIEAKS
ncbi:MAG: hypothetical protein KR126chlam1_00770 [Chlamydiae bacterium]|nr:hypothetical protein [Chlamydiota bacterium]